MIHDLRFAVRQLWKAPGFTVTAVLVLALGIGANTAIFSLVHTMLFAPPGYARPNELVQIFSQDTKNPKSFRAFSYPTLNDIREQNSVFSGVAGHNVADGRHGREEQHAAHVCRYRDGKLFPGVWSGAGDGARIHPRRRTAGPRGFRRSGQLRLLDATQSRAVLGSEIQINGRSFTVIGVLPKTFTGMLAVLSPESGCP